ncbi:phenylalanine--tRNA ligase subunit beta [Candidatus Micrarchaeota archaeon]|nr:phenylalanine--tRNA ligase subunit beta [Candidatus Micrarchaeota archaeon]MBU1930148.1 phenylalanine--tRNA ligase subunit beta [Candidatus Micrarchaeota archaeon]
MPTLEMSKKDFEKLVGKKFASRKELEEALWKAKTELEELNNDSIKASLEDTNRPDLLSTEGIARELRYKLGLQKKIQAYKTKKSGITATIDPDLKNIRPKAAYAVAWNVKVSNEFLGQMIQLQEKICQTFGQKRKEVAIGVFDLDKVNGNVRYFAADPKTEFIPLEYKVKMSLDEILKEHPKGKEFACLLSGQKKYPLLVDSKNEVLSFPPIINSAGSGKVTEQTKNLFLDVTGFNQNKVNTALSIFCAALADRKATIGSVEIQYGTKKITTPSFEKKKIVFKKDLIETITGMQKNDSHWKKRFQESGFETTFKGNKIECYYSNLRQDILHGVDVIEDALISEGYNNIPLEEIKLSVIGNESPKSLFVDAIRDACIGMGLQEVLSFTLSSREKQETLVGLQKETFVEIANPTSLNTALFRKTIFPELLAFLAKNKHAVYPQHLFEVGKTLELDSKSDTGVLEKDMVCIVLSNRKTSFSEIKSFLQAICNAFQWHFSIQETNHPAFESGQTGLIQIEQKKGIIGVLNKATRDNFGLEIPVSILEIEL